ncbi:transposase, partial [Gemmatimonadota bacterium]
MAFSCKGRGACPSCNAKRMTGTAAHLVDHVFPHVPVRQFVLSVPKRLRPFLHHRPRTATAALHILLRALQATLREACPTAPADASFGAVSFLHRFGSSLNPHYHFHLCVVDGLFERIDSDQGPENPTAALRFHEATVLSPQLLDRLQHTVRKRVLRHFARHGLL